MIANSEIQCIFVFENLTKRTYVDILRYLLNEGMNIHKTCPGYLVNKAYNYPNWKNMDQAFLHIHNSIFRSCCVNLIKCESNIKVSVTGKFDSNVVFLTIDEEVFINIRESIFDLKKLDPFVKLSEQLASKFVPSLWRICQEGIDFTTDLTKHLYPYREKQSYELDRLRELKAWYDTYYLKRWQT